MTDLKTELYQATGKMPDFPFQRRKEPAEYEIKQYILQGNSLTAQQALRMFGHFRLAVVINRLRNEGYRIETKMITEKGKRFAKYKLINQN